MISGKGYDFLGMETEIRNYCEQNQIPRRTGLHLQLAFEETVNNILVPMLQKPDICVTIEYSEETEKASFTARYGGERKNPVSFSHRLPFHVLKTAAEHIKYRWEPEQERANEITMTILP